MSMVHANVPLMTFGLELWQQSLDVELETLIKAVKPQAKASKSLLKTAENQRFPLKFRPKQPVNLPLQVLFSSADVGLALGLAFLRRRSLDVRSLLAVCFVCCGCSFCLRAFGGPNQLDSLSLAFKSDHSRRSAQVSIQDYTFYTIFHH